MSDPVNEMPVVEPSPAVPLDLAETVAQLQGLVCGLGAMVLVLSLAFNIFVWKQNRNVNAITNGRRAQLSQLQSNVKGLTVVANELANYSEGRPELTAIFKRYGIELKNVPPAGTR